MDLRAYDIPMPHISTKYTHDIFVLNICTNQPHQYDQIYTHTHSEALTHASVFAEFVYVFQTGFPA